VLHVAARLLAREQAQLGVVGDPARDVLELLALERTPERGVPEEDEAHDEARVHVEVREHLEQAERLRAHLVHVVEDQDGSPALAIGGGLVEALLHGADEDGEGASRFGSDGEGDLAAHVAAGEVGDLDVMDGEARLGEAILEGTHRDRLAGAGGRDECDRLAL